MIFPKPRHCEAPKGAVAISRQEVPEMNRVVIKQEILPVVS